MADSVPASPAFDPYEPRPTFIQRHASVLAAAAVFISTVVLTVMSFPPFSTPEFAYAMLAPAAYWAYTRPRLKLFAWTMFAAQAVAWTLLLGWLHNVTWVGLFLLGPFVGAWVGTWFLAAWWTLPRMIGRPTAVRLLAMLGLAGVWVVIEWTRSWLLGGFPWNPLAATQWKMVSMIQIAAFTGATGVSFVIVVVNLGFAAYAHRLFREGVTGLNKRSQEFFLALFIVLACFTAHVRATWNRGQFAEPFLRAAVVQPYIPQNVKWDATQDSEIRHVLATLSLTAAATKPDLIVWPEAATPWAVRGDDNMKLFVEAVAKRAQVPLLLGSIAIEQPKTPQEAWANGAFVVTPERGLLPDYYAKRQLVPFGEFVPLRPVLGWLSKFVPIGGDFSPGNSAAPLLVPVRNTTVAVAPLICYEDIYPSLARASTALDSSLLVVLTNNGWFGEGGAAYQHAAHAVLRAVENRRPVLRCGNGGWRLDRRIWQRARGSETHARRQGAHEPGSGRLDLFSRHANDHDHARSALGGGDNVLHAAWRVVRVAVRGPRALRRRAAENKRAGRVARNERLKRCSAMPRDT
jgi:apolipoprotein N-acyltransferase